ncbi:MAG: hypothetical protein HY286_19195 [Planctomycetes bacterium]|nr:hypothetical protein [Planctomycetota bacterium]
MSRALLEVLRSLFFASMRGRILLGLVCAYFALALPAILPFAETLHGRTNHNVERARFGQELDFTVWTDLRGATGPASAALLASVLAAFLLGLFTAGGWFEVLYKREGKPGLKVFCAGGGGRFFRFLRIALLSLLAIAGARWLFYGTPAVALREWLNGSADFEDFSSEVSKNRFVYLQSILFSTSLAGIVLVSDLARAALVVRGGRSAVIGIAYGLSLFFRRPLASIAAAGLPIVLEISLLYGLAWGLDYVSGIGPTTFSLIFTFILTQIIVLLRELTRAGRLGGLLAIADVDSQARMERRFGAFADPVIAAAGRAMTTDDEG